MFALSVAALPLVLWNMWCARAAALRSGPQSGVVRPRRIVGRFRRAPLRSACPTAAPHRRRKHHYQLHYIGAPRRPRARGHLLRCPRDDAALGEDEEPLEAGAVDLFDDAALVVAEETEEITVEIEVAPSDPVEGDGD